MARLTGRPIFIRNAHHDYWAMDLSLRHRSAQSHAPGAMWVMHRISPAFWREGGPQGRAEGIWGNDPGVLGLTVRSV